MTGACNSIKHDLNMCLREERLERTRMHNLKAKERNQKVEQAWKEIDEDIGEPKKV